MFNRKARQQHDDQVAQMQAEISSLRARLAAETQRADLGWRRYKESNDAFNALRHAKMPRPSQADAPFVDPLTCEHRWQGWPIAAKEGTEWCAACNATRDEPWTMARELKRLATDTASRRAPKTTSAGWLEALGRRLCR